jgi:flagellar biosynthesis/type III secretory pathway ATPase
MLAGAQATSQGGRHRVLLAFAENGAVIDVLDLRAPAGESESRALAGLSVRVRDALADHGVQRLGLWSYEGSPRGVAVTAARTPMRAEAVVLAVAGELGIEVVEISPTSLRKKGGHTSNDAAASATAAAFTGTWPPAAERAAAAAAVL